jgi:hypothetical protein
MAHHYEFAPNADTVTQPPGCLKPQAADIESGEWRTDDVEFRALAKIIDLRIPAEIRALTEITLERWQCSNEKCNNLGLAP